MASKLTRLGLSGAPESSYELKSHSGDPYTRLGLAALPRAPADVASTNILDASVGTFALTGNDVDFNRLNATVGTFDLTGPAVTLSVGEQINVEVGTFTLSGKVVKFDRDFPVTKQDYNATFIDAALDYSGQSAEAGNSWFPNTWWKAPFWGTGWWGSLESRVLTADPVAFTFTNPDSKLTESLILPAVKQTYALTGNNVTLSRSNTLSAVVGTFALTGNTIKTSVSMVAVKEAYIFAFRNARLHAEGDPLPGAGYNRTSTRIGIRIGI